MVNLLKGFYLLYHNIMFKHTVYYDKTVRTLEEALVRLRSCPYPILKYTQHFPINGQSTYISQRHNHEIIEFSFPPEISFITNIRNNHNCKMVTCVKNNETRITSQIIITPKTVIQPALYPNLTIILYNLMKTDVAITYDAYLIKDTFKAKL